MPSFTSSLLQLTSLMSSVSGLGNIKKHLFRASREVLLAFQGLLDVVEQYTSNALSKTDQQQTVQGIINYAQKMVRSLVRQLPRGDEEEYQVLHRKVMSSILEVIEGEIRRNSRLHNQKAKMKIEVFQAIRNVLLREMVTDHEPEGKKSEARREG